MAMTETEKKMNLNLTTSQGVQPLYQAALNRQLLTRAKKKLCISCARQRMLFGKTTANRVSRFIDEIPDEHIEKRNIPRGYGFGEKSTVQREYGQRPSYQTKSRPVSAPVQAAAKPAPAPSFKVGERVRHRAFGDGQITKMTPMGNDQLIEISFDGGITKKLMLRAAALHMVKI